MEKHLWVKLTQPYKDHPAGELVQVETAELKSALIDAKIGEDCEDQITTALDDAIAKSAKAVVDSVLPVIEETVSNAVKSLGEQVTAASEKARKHFVPAVPIDHEEEARGGFAHMGEFARDVMESRTQPSEKLLAFHRTKAPTGVNTINDAEGGFLMPEAFSSQFLERVYAENNLAGRTQALTTSFNALKIPGVDESSRADGSRWGGIRSYWVQEANQATSSTPKFRQVEMSLHKMIVLSYATEEMLSDSGFNLEGWLTDKMGQEMNFKVSDSIINGSGAGKPQGIVNANATVSVAKETGQAAATLEFDNIVKMYSRMWAGSRSTAVWFINQDIEPQLFSMTLPVGTAGVPVYLPANGLSASPFGTLLGRPVVPLEWCPTLGTVGDIIFADLSQYATLTKVSGGVKSSMSIHLRFDYDELAFKATFRIDGQSLWHKPLTPFKGSNTQSPFITLATRA